MHGERKRHITATGSVLDASVHWRRICIHCHQHRESVSPKRHVEVKLVCLLNSLVEGQEVGLENDMNAHAEHERLDPAFTHAHFGGELKSRGNQEQS